MRLAAKLACFGVVEQGCPLRPLLLLCSRLQLLSVALLRLGALRPVALAMGAPFFFCATSTRRPRSYRIKNVISAQLKMKDIFVEIAVRPITKLAV